MCKGRGQAREGRWGQLNAGRGIFGSVVVVDGVAVCVGLTTECDVMFGRRQRPAYFSGIWCYLDSVCVVGLEVLSDCIIVG